MQRHTSIKILLLTLNKNSLFQLSVIYNSKIFLKKLYMEVTFINYSTRNNFEIKIFYPIVTTQIVQINQSMVLFQ
jgi:hypothetical protein